MTDPVPHRASFRASRRDRPAALWLGLVAILLFGGLLPPTSAHAQVEPDSGSPNFLIIFTDDQGWNDVGCYGSEIPTPNIDRLAAGGLRFTQFYAASSICTPSRFGLLTGRNPSRSRDQLLGALMFMAEEDKDRGIHTDETTVAKVLREEGYTTALIGKWHLGHGKTSLLPRAHGFDLFRGHTGGCIDFFTMTYGKLPDWYHNETHVSENGYATDLITDEAVAYLESRARLRDKPFFLHLAYNAPHFGKGYSPSKDEPVNLMQPTAETLRRVSGIPDKVRREFAAMTVSLDDGVGRVLDALDRFGLADDTVVIFQTDHGGDPTYGGSNRPLRGDKATLFEGGLRVPCLIRWPGRIAPGVSDEVAWAVDWFPTLCGLAGIDTPEGLPLDGLDLSAFLLDGRAVGERELFWEIGAHNELERKPWTALRSGRWKYLETPEEGDFLFDLEADPNEMRNLIEEQSERVQDLRDRARQLADDYRS